MTPLLTPEQAAKELGIGVDTLHAMRKAGEIRYVNIGRGKKRETPRYDLDDLMEWREKRKQRAWPLRHAKTGPTGFIGVSSNTRANEFLRALERRESAKRKSGRKASAPNSNGSSPSDKR
jgi:excisionase family DNA binding protein